MHHDPAKRRQDQHKLDLAGREAPFDSPMLSREDDREPYGELYTL
jgi:hypothetical protein